MGIQRPRQHVLKEKGEKAFELALPDEWVKRGQYPDYALDYEVELVGGGRLNGSTFKAQVKATDSEFEGAVYYDHKLEDIWYWNSLDVPVLIVQYCAKSDVLYARWSFTLDLTNVNPGQKTVRVKFSNADRLNRMLPHIETSMEIVQGFRKGPPPRFYRVSVMLEDSSKAFLLKRSLANFFETSTGAGRIFALDRTPASCDSLTITACGDERLRVSLPFDVGSVSLPVHWDGGIDDVAPAMVLGVATILAWYGHFPEAVDMAKSVGLTTAAWASPQFAPLLSKAIFECRRLDMSLDIAEFVARSKDDTKLQLMLMYSRAAMIDIPRLTDEQYCQLIRVWELAGDDLRLLGEYDQALSCDFNRANCLWARGEYDSAFRALSACVEEGRRYDTPDNQVLLGSIAFRAGRFADSVEHYEAAARERPTEKVVQLLADALMHAGQYEEALAVLKGKWGIAPTDRLSTVNQIALRQIAAEIGVPSQLRCSDEITNESASRDDELSPTTAMELLREEDALFAPAWLTAFGGDLASWPAGRLVLLARLFCVNPQLWALAVVKCAQDPTLASAVPSLIAFGLADCGGAFVDRLIELVGGGSDPLVSEAQRQFLGERADQPVPSIDFGGAVVPILGPHHRPYLS